MKKILLSLFILSIYSNQALSSCYQNLKDQSGQIINEFCFDYVFYDIDNNIVILNETNGRLPIKMTPIYSARRNENGYRFRIKYEQVKSVNTECSENITVSYFIEAQTDNDGLVQTNHLDIKALTQTTNPQCQDQRDIEKFEYRIGPKL